MRFSTGHMQGDSWIGLEMNGGSYKWIDSGQELGDHNWASSAEKTKQCVYARESSGVWIDASCSEPHTYVCKMKQRKRIAFESILLSMMFYRLHFAVEAIVITPTPPETSKKYWYLCVKH